MNFDISDSDDGMTISIWLQGCPHRCKGCHNPETWNDDGGYKLSDENFKSILYDSMKKLNDKTQKVNISILGGEPLHEFNILGTIKLAKAFKEKFPNKTIWVWTGFLFENVINKDIFKYIDVLVDGRFEEEHKDIRLKYCGSTNQRVIDIQQSLKKNKVILYSASYSNWFNFRNF